MANIIFLQRFAEEWLGPMYISSMLKSRGHQCAVMIEALEDSDYLRKICALSPDLIAMSCLTSDYHWAVSRAQDIRKRSKAPIILGGTHPTLNPDESISDPAIDMICIGEGEYPMAELADALDHSKDYSAIANLWVKKDVTIIKNDVRALIENLNQLPFPDRELYRKYPFFRKRGKRPIHLSRGCPYDCSYCHNAGKKQIFRGKGGYVRWRSQDNILREIRDIEQTSFIKVLHVIDDSFGLNSGWLITFLERLAGTSQKKLVLQANMRADMVTEDLCQSFQNYGVSRLRIRIAVETGNEDYRQKILKKNIHNRTLLKAAHLFNKYKIGFITYNMVGLPGESLKLALETLELNIQLQPSLAICFIYQPYPGTELSAYACRIGALDDSVLGNLGGREFEGFYDSRSPLRQKDIEKIENLQKIFSLTVRHPALASLFRVIIKYRSASPFLSLIYKIYVRKIIFQRLLKDRY
jgi:anaerobic magnesium-protoporphyrin IX monomethyl ester cyclase